jgi:hypothetical protein
MARSVTFNGITRFRPGGITRINAEALNQIGVTAGGVLGLVGEADGGAPGSEVGLVSLRDPAEATSLFRSGPIVDAIKLAFQSSGDPLIPGGAAEVVVYKTNASTRSSVQLPSFNENLFATTATAGATTTVIPVAATLVASALVGRWAEIAVPALPGSPTFLRQIASNTGGAGTSSITISPALPQAPAATNTVNIRATLIELTSRDHGQHTSSIDATVDYNPTDESYQVITEFEGEQQISPTLGGRLRNYLHVVYRGGPTSATTAVVSGSTASVINVTPASLVAAAHANRTVVVRDASGNVKAISKINTNGTGDITLDVNLTAAPISGDLIEILGVTSALGQFNGSNGVATSFTTTITGVVGDNLNISIPVGLTVRQLANLINTNTNYLATIPSQINGDVELATQFDFGNPLVVNSTSINMQTSFSGTVATTGFRQDIKEIVAWINNTAEYLTAVRFTADALDGSDGNTVDYPGTTGDPLPWTFRLAGGTRGISSNSDFQSGFDAMLLRVVDEVVPLIDQDLVNEGYSSTATWAAVSAQLVDHVTAARGAAGLERGGWLGFRGTKEQIIQAANGVNDADIALVAQNPTVVGATGDLVQKGPRELAVMGASMRLGVNEVGEPLTNKFLRASAMAQDPSWDPSSVTDSGDFILNGVMFAETLPGRGTRWVRDMTTWVKDDNLAFSEGSVRDVVRYVAYNLRTTIESRFTGRKATPATVASVKDTASALLETFRSANIIVDSTDPATGTTIRAYHSLKVFSSGDIIRLNVGIFPVPGINFELIDIYLSLPTQSA